MKNLEPRTFVILGPQRSGTSLLSHMMADAGVPIGDLYNNIVYEDQLAYDINNCVLQQAGGDYKNPPSITDIEATNLSALFQFYVWKRNYHPVWSFKVPTNTLLVEQYEPFLRSPFFIATTRDIDESRKSIMKQNKLTWEQTEYVAEYHLRRDKFLGSTNHPWIKIEFKDLIEKPKETVEQLRKFTGIALTTDVIDKGKPQFYAKDNKTV